jgi:hypothetical protein
MKTRFFLFTLVTLLSIAAASAEDKSGVDKTISSLNSQAKSEGGPDRVLKTISKNTGVPVAKLQAQKSKSNLSYGELYIANAIATASGKSFDQVAAMRTGGKSWAKIAEENNVSMGGSPTKKAAGAKATPKPEKEKSAREKYEERQWEKKG